MNMSIYSDTAVTEQPIYASTPLGVYQQGVAEGHQVWEEEAIFSLVITHNISKWRFDFAKFKS